MPFEKITLLLWERYVFVVGEGESELAQVMFTR